MAPAQLHCQPLLPCKPRTSLLIHWSDNNFEKYAKCHFETKVMTGNEVQQQDKRKQQISFDTAPRLVKRCWPTSTTNYDLIVTHFMILGLQPISPVRNANTKCKGSNSRCLSSTFAHHPCWGPTLCHAQSCGSPIDLHRWIGLGWLPLAHHFGRRCTHCRLLCLQQHKRWSNPTLPLFKWNNIKSTTRTSKHGHGMYRL